MNDDIKKKCEELLAGTCSNLCGFRIDSISYGECRMSCELGPLHINPFGTVHGGMLCAMIDDVAGITGFTLVDDTQYCVTQNCFVSFLRPARGKKLYAVSSLIKNGRATSLIVVDVYDDADKLVARGEVTLFHCDK